MIETFLNKTENKKGSVTSFLQDILKEIMSIVGAESGSLFLFDADTKELILDAFYNSEELGIKELKTKLGEGIAGQVANIKKPVLVKDIDTDVRFQRNGYKHYRTKSFMSVPLFGPHGLIGLMNIADKSTGDSFTEKDLECANALCRYACVIADNLQQFEKLKKEREELNEHKRLLEKYASVGKLAAGVVHEVNNPLDGIIRYTNILLNHINNDSIAKEYLLEIKKGLNRIARTTRSLLEFSHQVNSGTPKTKSYADLHELINESVDVFKNRIQVNNIEIKKYFSREMPRIADFGLTHVCINMIKNAIDAMPEGGTLEIASAIKDDAVLISFKDTGTGIQEEVKKDIFEPFFTTKSIDKGTGLGLSICLEIINKYGGNIHVESEPLKGTVFTLTIPKAHLENAQ
ncbi:MAG: ATP-binding protein [Candidatus Omnitrophica bacterium]|nr:ATP-binding protein [Candidatus Omnitrophota bacterium]